LTLELYIVYSPQKRRYLKMADRPNPTPPEWKAGNISYGTGITLKLAKEMLEAGEREAEKQGVPMAMTIVDAGGNLVAFRRMDNVMLASINISMDKAFTAVFGKLPTSFWSRMLQGGGLLFIHERWITFQGGFPIISNGVLIGGLGVSGGTVEDIHVAKAALEAGGFSTDAI
jgi:uncharacterized protein GlcG (DUF336 family)